MSDNLIILLPHYGNLRLRLINLEIMANMPEFDLPSESECEPQAGLTDPQAPYEQLPLLPDS